MQLHRERDAIAARGARLVFVGNGSPQFAVGFRDEFGITSEIYVDEGRAAYAALGFRRGGLGDSLNPGLLRNVFRAMRGGFRQTSVQGDAWQLGGVVIVDAEGRLRYRYASRVAGDHPAPSAIIEALSGS